MRSLLNKKKKIVVIGGGTGTFTVLSGLKQYPAELSAVVAMADDGGSTGMLRDELGVLPPGDVRQCLVALSESPLFLRRLMSYRFLEGRLKGHSFGNLLLSALEKMTGSFDEAVEKTSDVLRIEGKVIPATLRKTSLVATLKNGRVIRGQSKINSMNLARLARIRLEPHPRVNPKAVQAIRAADVIVIGPGDLYSSLIPNLLVSGLPEAVRNSKAKKIYISNLMTKVEHTDGFTVNDYVLILEHYLGGMFDYVIYNSKKPSPRLIRRYAHKGEHPVLLKGKLANRHYKGAPLVSKKIFKTPKGDLIPRTLIRHDSDRLARIIMNVIGHSRH